MLLIPSIDLRGGHCVRLLRGDFAAETRYQVDAPALLARYRALGASWLHIVDLDGARDGEQSNRELIGSLARQSGLALQVGGGVRSAAVVAELLRAGVARVVIGSVAVEQPALVITWLREHGPERICLAFDVRLDAQSVPRLQTRGWRTASTRSLWDGVAEFAPHGLRHVLCTDIERDGALAGPNTALYREALQRHPQLQWQASGGIAEAADLAALAALGMPAAISGKALLEERIHPSELRPFLPNA
ncbi:MAG TPA: HisA/HisF-related TIM barrel protein [Steroidobacteraceae bacterium]|nr:HisA/HisF-related TIM barrel protein [Steroidobacteraceae bacterium]